MVMSHLSNPGAFSKMYPKFTNRDKDILIDVYAYRYLSLSQIERLHFPSKRTCQRRLQTLHALGYLKSFTTPNLYERIFYLDKKGAEVIAYEWKTDIASLDWHRHNQPKDYYFLKHFLYAVTGVPRRHKYPSSGGGTPTVPTAQWGRQLSRLSESPRPPGRAPSAEW